MKKAISILLLCATVLLAVPEFAFADSKPAKTIPMKRGNRNGSETPLDPFGQRTPPAPVICTISQDGIYIAGIDRSQISVYEAYDIDGLCIASCSSEAEFISFTYQVQEEIEIRLYTADYVFSGWWLP